MPSLQRLIGCLACAALLLSVATASATPTQLTSNGDPRMARLMDSWLTALHRQHPEFIRGPEWRHTSEDAAVGALMFETADMAPMTRRPNAAETAPYAHQFAGDMMKAPWLIQVAGSDSQPAYIALNRRPGAPLPPKVSTFLRFALSDEGQRIVASEGSFAPLDARIAQQERTRLDGFIAPLDPELPPYRPENKVSGYISSDGSDGMKTLMDRWMRDFRAKQPKVRPGARWEHLGTLNGFHALLAGQADIAPMGRELWPSERAAYRSVLQQDTPLEIRVARGGFNTPQRTTAQAIFVHPSNPLGQLTVSQLRAIFAEGGAITRWGQLGLTGEWAERPIAIYMPPPPAPNAMSLQMGALAGAPWKPGAHSASLADTARAIADNPGAIGFGGMEEGGPGLKALAIAAGEGEPAYALDYSNASSGRYPLTRYMYIRLNRAPGQPLAPAVREFLRFILSREGQEPILYSGYFPLNAQEVREELSKLR